jgi:hypothetical protein
MSLRDAQTWPACRWPPVRLARLRSLLAGRIIRGTAFPASASAAQAFDKNVPAAARPRLVNCTPQIFDTASRGVPRLDIPE